MNSQLQCFIILTSFTFISCKGVIDKLPLCPTSIQYFPQNLPMHCRMPRSADFSELPQPPNPPQLPPNPSEKEVNPSQMQGLFPPPPFPVPGGPIPGAPFPVAMPMMPMPGPSHKLPVIVMPFYSPDPAFKKKFDRDESINKPRRPKNPRKKHRQPPRHHDEYDDDSGADDSNASVEGFDSGSKEGWWKGKGKKKRSKTRKSGRRHSSNFKRRHKASRELLTPVLQYVTKDGYVIFEKQISKDEAKDWLKVNKDSDQNENASRDKDTKLQQEKSNSKEHHKSHEENHRSMEHHMSAEKGLVIGETTTEKQRKSHHHHHHHKPNTLVDNKLMENPNLKEA